VHGGSLGVWDAESKERFASTFRPTPLFPVAHANAAEYPLVEPVVVHAVFERTDSPTREQRGPLSGPVFPGRFKSQALLDESAVWACLAYVDLNPIRAGIAKTPETFPLTSAYPAGV